MSLPDLPPAERVWVVRRSLACLGMGCGSLVPGLGAPLAVMAVAEFWRVSRRARGHWNPARRELLLGLWLGLVGCVLLLNLLLVAGLLVIRALTGG